MLAIVDTIAIVIGAENIAEMRRLVDDCAEKSIVRIVVLRDGPPGGRLTPIGYDAARRAAPTPR